MIEFFKKLFVNEELYKKYENLTKEFQKSQFNYENRIHNLEKERDELIIKYTALQEKIKLEKERDELIYPTSILNFKGIDTILTKQNVEFLTGLFSQMEFGLTNTILTNESKDILKEEDYTYLSAGLKFIKRSKKLILEKYGEIQNKDKVERIKDNIIHSAQTKQKTETKTN